MLSDSLAKELRWDKELIDVRFNLCWNRRNAVEHIPKGSISEVRTLYNDPLRMFRSVPFAEPPNQLFVNYAIERRKGITYDY